MPGAKVDPEMDVAAPETDVGFLPFDFGTEMDIDGDAGKLALGSTSFALPFALAVASCLLRAFLLCLVGLHVIAINCAETQNSQKRAMI